MRCFEKWVLVEIRSVNYMSVPFRFMTLGQTGKMQMNYM